jgi:hypothetical protein
MTAYGIGGKRIMKRAILFLGIFLIGVSQTTGAEDYFFNHEFGYEVTDGIGLLVEEGTATLFMYFPEEKTDYWAEFRAEDLRYGKDGFARLSCFGQEAIVILGGNHIMLHLPGYPGSSMYKPRRDLTVRPNIWKPKRFRVAEVTASSTLSEVVRGRSIRYTPDNLIGVFVIDPMGIECLWNHHSLPWVEGEEGPGIGSRIEVRFTEAVDHMLLVNGFVDLSRKHLYKMNSRAKRVRISSLDPDVPFVREYTFEDRVQFHHIPFPDRTEKVEVKILEVYTGSRWQDTSVSAVLTNRTYNRYQDGTFQRYKRATAPYSSR